MTLILDANDRTYLINGIEALLVPVPPATVKQAAIYSAYSTICLGKATNYVLTNFKIHFDLLKHVFDDVQYNTLGIEDSNSQLYRFLKTGAVTAKPSRSTTSTVKQIRKKTGSRAFQGRRFRFGVPSAKAAQLYKSGFKKTANRKKASMLFPYAATNPQVAAWFSTHQTPGGTNVVNIVSEKGTAMGISAITTQLAHDAEVGVFNPITRGRLDATKKAKELDPA